MTDYVCTQLNPPDSSGMQTCQSWSEQAPFFPQLTSDQTSQICTATGIFLVTCAIYRHLRKSVS